MAALVLLGVAVLAPSASLARGSEDASRRAYERARVEYYALKNDPVAMRYRDRWLQVIDAFATLARQFPKSSRAPKALYNCATLGAGLYEVSRRPADLDEAIAAFARVASRYPRSSLADDALFEQALLYFKYKDERDGRRILEKIVAHYPRGDKIAPARARLLQQPDFIARVAARKRVVIDPGHGGHDTGAIGHGRVLEKNVVMKISLEVARYLEATGVEAILTRNKDVYLSLSERTAFANERQADLFVSIHANSAPDTSARGVETYYLDVTSDTYALRLAAIENQTSEQAVSDLQLILADLSAKANTQESIVLAGRVQENLFVGVSEFSPGARDYGAKPSLFYVLLGARMPAILVETSFLSNRREARLLASARYQRRLAKAIADGINEHLKTPLKVVRP